MADSGTAAAAAPSSSQSPAPSSDSTHSLLSSSVPYLSSFFLPYPLQLHHSTSAGRYVTATACISKDSCVFQSRAFAKGVHSSFLRRVCDSCWRYQHGRGWALHCFKCKQVWWCSKRCMRAAGGRSAAAPAVNTAETAAEERKEADEAAVGSEVRGADGREWLDVDEPHAVLDRGLHSAECATVRRLAGLKADKDTQGVLRLIVRVYFKLQRDAADAGAAPPPPLSESSPALCSSAQHTPVPVNHDFHLLIGHNAAPLPSLISPSLSASASPLTTSSHSLFWVQCKAHFLRLFPPTALPALYSILAKMESNAFSLYAAPPDKPPATPPAPPTDESASSSASSSSAASSSPSSPSQSVSSSSSATVIDRENLGHRSIGRSLYPSASFFNHSCRPNCEVFETGSVLSVHAQRDVSLGEELSIAYIDCNQRLRARRQQLQQTYFFHCRCDRCSREEQLEAGQAQQDASEADVPISYDRQQGGRERGRKRNARLKRKKIQAKKQQSPEAAAGQQAGTADAVSVQTVQEALNSLHLSSATG